MESKQDLLDKLHEFSKVYIAAMKELETEQEAYWNSLTKDDQLKCFCAISRRILKGEIEDRGSYRWVLYDVFNFGPEAYAQAQDAGYLTIHNCIYSSNYEEKLLKEFAKHLGASDPEKAVTEFYESRKV